MKIRSNFLILAIMLCLLLIFLCWGLCKELLSHHQTAEDAQVASATTCYLSDGNCEQGATKAPIKPAPKPTAKPRYQTAPSPQNNGKGPRFFNSTKQTDNATQNRTTAHNSAAIVAAQNGLINTAGQTQTNAFPYKNSIAMEGRVPTGAENLSKSETLQSNALLTETTAMVPPSNAHSVSGFTIKYAATNKSRHQYAVACGFGGLFNAFWKAWLSKSENMAPAADINGTAHAELTDNGIQYPAGTYYLCVKATQENNNCTGGDYFWGVHNTQIISRAANSAQAVEAQCFTDSPSAKNATQNCLRSDKSGEEGDAIRWSCKSYNFKGGHVYEIKMNTYGL